MASYPEHRSDQLCADWMRGSVLEARQLAETDLSLYNDYVFLQSVIEEAKPRAEEIATKQAEQKRKSDKFARQGIVGAPPPG